MKISKIISIIENLPKELEYEGVLYQLSMHVTAWRKLCLGYCKMFDEDNGYRYIFSQVVEPQMENNFNVKDAMSVNRDIPEIVDVKHFNQAVIILKQRVDEALENKSVKVLTSNEEE